MAKSQSGRLVIEVDPAFKRRLYSTLAIEGSTLKGWFIKAACTYIDEVEQPCFQELKKSSKSDERK